MTQTLPLDYSTLAPPRKSWIAWINLFGTVAALILIYIAFGILRPESFFTLWNVVGILRQSTIVSVAAMGMTLIILAGGIDLSTGSMIALTTVVIAHLLTNDHAPLVAVTGGILIAIFCGMINGSFVVALRVVPFIVTLGTLMIYRGGAEGIAHEQKIDAPLTWLNDLLAAPRWRNWPQLKPLIFHGKFWQIFPTGVWMMFALVALMAAVLRYTVFGRHCVAVGSNEQTARLCGVHVQRTKILVYAIGGFFAGVAGLMQFSRLTVGDPTVAVGLELDVIAAVVIGGGSLSGGEGSPLGSLIGAAIMTTINSGCRQMGIDNWVQKIVTGSIIIVAVALDRLRRRRAAAIE
jgi:ribose/xylose/arabinose/galactoside ABC-type transport system permease subunit